MTEQMPKRVVGISISTPPDLAQLGFGQEHMHELMIAISRTLLRIGDPDQPVHLAYGGDLRPGGFTETMLDLARAESVIARNEAGTADKDGQAREPGRIYSYLAWPYYADLTKSYEAQHLNVCSFIRVTPEDAGFDADRYPETIAPSELSGDDALFLKARCISHLRELMNNGKGKTFDGSAPALTARVILGGKTNRYSGVMPGIFEEFMLAQESRPVPIPTYLVGGFGGAARDLADATLQNTDTLPPVLTLEGQASDEANADLRELKRIYAEKKTRPSLDDRYARLGDTVRRYRADLDNPGPKACSNGLSRADNERLMRSCNIAEITGLIERGLHETWPSNP